MMFREIKKPGIKTRVALSIDLEDYYHANYPGYDYRSLVHRDSRLMEPTEIILKILDRNNSKATFFVLGEIAYKYPKLIKRIADGGHEIATHGENHLLITQLGRDETIKGLRKSVLFLEDLTGKKVYGYRAPNFSAHPRRTPWLFEELVNLGLVYDSSRFPARTYYGGEPKMKKFPFLMEITDSKNIWEVPVSCDGPPFFRLAWSGGFYWRILPLNLVLKKTSNLIYKNKPVVLYLHPKDIDSQNPSLPIGRLSNWIHQVRTKKGRSKLREMASKIELARIIDLIPEIENDKKKEEKEEFIESELALV